MRKSLFFSLFVVSSVFIACGGDSDGDIDKHVNEHHSTLSAPTAQAATDISATEFEAHWTAVSGAIDYDIDVAKDAGFTNIVTHQHGIGGTTAVPSGLESNKEYHYRIKAFNGTNVSPYSNSISVLTKPSAPVANEATDVEIRSFQANWEALEGITTYELFVTQDGQVLPDYNGKEISGTSVVVDGLTPNRQYYYVVKAKNSSGSSEESNRIGVATPLDV